MVDNRVCIVVLHSCSKQQLLPLLTRICHIGCPAVVDYVCYCCNTIGQLFRRQSEFKPSAEGCVVNNGTRAVVCVNHGIHLLLLPCYHQGCRLMRWHRYDLLRCQLQRLVLPALLVPSDRARYVLPPAVKKLLVPTLTALSSWTVPSDFTRACILAPSYLPKLN